MSDTTNPSARPTSALTWVPEAGALPPSPEMDRRFDLHAPPSAEAGDLMDRIRASYKALAIGLEAELPPGREASLAITRLEESLFFAIGSVVRPPAARS